MSKNLFVCQSYFEFDEESNSNSKKGMLLSVTCQSLNIKSFYFDCSWCSSFPVEEEILLSIYPVNTYSFNDSYKFY